MPTLFQPTAPSAEKSLLQGSLFLINKDGTVLAAQQESPLLKVGDSLYQALGVSPDEQQQLVAMQYTLLPNSFLFMAGSRPLVAWCAFLSRTDLLAVFAPEGEIRTCLSAPAALADALAKQHIILSRGALARHLPFEEYTSAQDWIHAIQAPLFDGLMLEAPIFAEDGSHRIRPQALADLLATRTAAMARLIGVTLDADWQGLGLDTLPYPDLAWVTACLFSLFLTVRRVSDTPEVLISITHEGPDGPVLEARFSRRDETDPLAELFYLWEDARARNELFALVHPPEDPTKLLLRFSVCRKDLSYLSLKGTPRLR